MKTLAPSLTAGAVSALLYVVTFTFGLGFLFLFLPTLPIFWLGLSKRPDQALQAGLIGATLLVILTNPASALCVYLMLLALPAWYISRECLKFGSAPPIVIWFPITAIFARLMTAFCFTLLAITLYFSGTEGGLPGLIAPRITAALSMLSNELSRDTSDALDALAPSLSFFVFSVSAWMWGLCLYLHGWVTNRELIRQTIAVRPDMTIVNLPPPNWMITLLLIAAFASLAGSTSLAFWGKSSIIILLFPYFLLGLSLVHTQVRLFEYRFLLLFLLYFLLALLLWPVLIIAGYGVIYHVRLLNKYLSAGGTSSRN